MDIKATLLDGSIMKWTLRNGCIAASQGLKKAMAQAEPLLLEPVMKVEIIVPEEYTGDVISDFTGRRGRILGTEVKDGVQVIRGAAPLTDLFGYATELRSRTQGRGVYNMEFYRFEEVPQGIAHKIITKTLVY